MSSLPRPPGYPRVKRVHSFHELVTTRFADGVNALCWQRELIGDFNEIVKLLGRSDADIVTLDEALLNSLPVSAAGRAAIDILLDDQRLLWEHDLDPSLNLVHGYLRNQEPGPIATDVFSFHADSATMEADTYLCTYHGPTSEGVANEEARRRVDIPATRAELLKIYNGKDDDGFREFLNEHCYDLHYAASPQAGIFSFGQGNLWRIAIEYPGCPVPPCIHRAPAHGPGDPPRLMLIS